MKRESYLDNVSKVLAGVEENSGHGAIYHALNEDVTLRNNAVCAFCRQCLTSPVTAPFCRSTCENATNQSLASGEPFFYTCWAGLLFLTVAVAPRHVCRGGISVGGFCPRGEEANIRNILTGRLPGAVRSEIVALLPTLRSISPSELRGIGAFVVEATFSSGLNSSSFFRQQSEKYGQQRQIAEACQVLGAKDLSPTQLLLKAEQLAEMLTAGEREPARVFSSTYLASLLLACQWDLGRLKAHLRILLALLTRNALLQGADWLTSTGGEMRFLARLDAARTVEDTCYAMTGFIRQFGIQAAPEKKHSQPISERSTRWLQEHYREKVSLAAASKAIGASVSSIVQGLRNGTGKTFHQLLLEIRISEAKRLLATTSLGISEIAEACGFFDQSHFTHVLQQAINLAPGQFRRLLKIPPEEVLK